MVKDWQGHWYVEDELRPADRHVFDATWGFVAQINRIRRQVEHRLGLGDLELSTVRYLMARSAQGQETRQREVANHLGVKATTVSAVIDRLVKRGYVTRTPHSQDRRSLDLIVSPEGAATIKEAFGHVHASMVNSLRERSEEELEAIASFLGGFGVLEKQRESTLGVG